MSDSSEMVVLLDGLLAGTDRVLDSVGAWAERLNGDEASPLAARFVNQLADEWLDADPPDAFCAALAEQVRERLAAWHPGWPHLWAHVLRVTGAAVALTDDAWIDPALGFALGMCHDVAKLDEFRTGEPHEEVGAAFAGRALRGHFSPADVRAIQAAIRKHGGDALADVLHDADKLDKIGAAGLVRRVSTGTTRGWLPDALWRVADDARHFPPMRFPLSADLAASKLAFQAWLLPLADAAVGES
jgi:hypothetical protein